MDHLEHLPSALASLETIYSLDAKTHVEDVLRHLLSLADAAVLQTPIDVFVSSTSSSPDAAAAAPADNGWLAPLVDTLEAVLRYIQTGLDTYKVPYSYGWSIVALTAFVKLLTLPLTKQQVESNLAMQALKPKIDAIKELYGDQKEAISRETSALYEKAGVNPLAGCLPSIATIPIFIGLYRSLTSVAATGELDNQGFYWIPSLAGPTSVAAQKAGAGTAWLLPLVDGVPPIGWETAIKYLALPIALVAAQYVSSAIIAPPVDPEADNAKVQKTIFLLLPLMVGWFALNVPSGLSLYYFSNTVFTSAQQVFLRKLGGAKQADFDLGPIDLGRARRTGASVLSSSVDGTAAASAIEIDVGGGGGENSGALAFSSSSSSSGEDGAAVMAVETAAAVPTINKRCKRKRRDLVVESA